MPSYISGDVTKPIVLNSSGSGAGSGYYASPLTISGSVYVSGDFSDNSSDAVNTSTADASLTNNGLIHGLNDTATYYNGGWGANFTALDTTLQNNATIAGGLSGVGDNLAGAGGVGVQLNGATLLNVNNTGGTGITGGAGYGYGFHHLERNYGGDGVVAIGSTVNNGNASLSGTIKGGAGESGANGGIGLFLDGGSATNSSAGSGSSIIGGNAGSGGGNGGIGVRLFNSTSLTNDATIAGGGSAAATGGVGVYASYGSVINALSGDISGGYSGSGASAAGVLVGKDGQLTNDPFATISSETGSGVGGVGVDLSRYGATATNTGVIKGGGATGVFAAGAGVEVAAYT